MEENGVGRCVGLDPIIDAFRPTPAELHGRYTLMQGSSPQDTSKAIETLGGLPDLVFIDAMHTHDHVVADFTGVLPYVPTGGHILFHDTFHQGIDQGVREVIAANPDLVDCGFITRNAVVAYPVSGQGLRMVRKGMVDGERLIAEAYESSNLAAPSFSREVWNYDRHHERVGAASVQQERAG
jgi:hypothetical protein